MTAVVGPAAGTRHLTPPAAVALVCAAAWVLVIVAEVTGVGRHLHHDAVLHTGAPSWAAVALFLAGWLVMVAAMMLPATLPALRGWALPGGAPATAVVARFLAGFAGVWTAAGAFALGFDAAVHEVVHAVPTLTNRRWLVAASLLAVAGTAPRPC